MIDGSSLGHANSFLKFSKMFLRISLDAIYNFNILDSQSDIYLFPLINIYHYF